MYIKLLILLGIFIIIYCVYYSQVETFKNSTFLNNTSKNNLIHNQKIPQQLDLLTYSTFSPDCCPSLYTKSSGCMCKDETNHDLLIMRGGNRMLKDTYIEHEKNSFLFPPKCPQCPELYERDKQYFELSSD